MTTSEQVKKSAAKKQQTASNPLVSSWVTASAGSGKTKVLADRYLRLLLEGVNPRVILCLTFTKSAASEMQNRITKKLQNWATAENDDDIIDDLKAIYDKFPNNDNNLNLILNRAKQLFAVMLDAVSSIKIQTIHSFCQHILKRFPLEANIPPHFAVMDDRDANELMQKAKDKVFIKAENNQVIAKALDYLSNLVPEMNFSELMNKVLSNRQPILEIALKHKDIESFTNHLHQFLNIKSDETPDSIFIEFFDPPQNKNDLLKAATILSEGPATLKEKAATITKWLADNLENKLQNYNEYKLCFLTKENGIRSCENYSILKKNPDIKTIIYNEADKNLLYKKRLDTLVIAKASIALFTIAKEIILQYEFFKNHNSLLDYDDLIAVTSNLLNQKDTASWVLYKLDNSIDHILIDEAQDTNPLQWSIIEAIASEFFAGFGSKNNSHRTIFAVGDRKQSIYSFQGADPEGFEKMKHRFKANVQNSGLKWEDVILDISFRSTRAVLQAVSEVFKSPENKKGVLLDDESGTHIPYRIGDEGLVEIWPFIEPYEKQPPEPWKPPVERYSIPSPKARLAELVANKIALMIKSKEILASKNRPIEPMDIMVLVRRRNDFVDELVKSLKNLNIPVSGVDRMHLCEQIAVMDMLSLVRFLLLPEDSLSLAEVLKSPLIGFDDDDLFEIAYNRGQKTLWESLKKYEGEFSKKGDAVDYLTKLLSKTDFIRPYELFSYVLNSLNGRKEIVSRLGVEVEDCLDELLNLALMYEKEHIPSLQGFILWLEGAETIIKRDLEKSSNNMVRIMTVHGAKGLQAPIVFLPDTMQTALTTKDTNIFFENNIMLWKPTASLNNDIVDKLKNQRQENFNYEYKRLLYVAMTRAEDRLYVCGYGKYKEKSWFDLIKTSLEPIAKNEVDAFLEQQRITKTFEVLKLTCPQENISTALFDKSKSIPDIKILPSWIFTNPEKEPTPPRPLAPSKPNLDEPAIFSPLGDDKNKHFLKGNLIHKLLQILPDITPAKQKQSALFYLQKNAANLEDSEIDNIIEQTFNVLKNPLFAPIFNSQNARAEVAVTGLIGKNIISGKIDRLLVTDDEVLIIDYKTSRMPPQNIADIPPLYLYQMSSYKSALENIYPKHKIKCAIIWTAIPTLMEIPNNIL